MGDVKWTPYGGVAADGEVPQIAAGLVREWKAGLLTSFGHTRTGDALVVWSVSDGALTLTWCLVRHEAEVRRG